MAQDITIAGASFQQVPSIIVPKTGSGTASFFDVSGTTAEAADVASGKVFYAADGTLTTGTASGGGGTMTVYAIRPDAELVQRWVVDERYVEDLAKTLPSYTTTATTLITGANLTPTITLDYTNYSYYYDFRALSIPIYSTTTKVKGRCDFTFATYHYDFVEIPANEIVSMDGSKAYTSRSVASTGAGSSGRTLYWTSATAIAVVTNTNYGPAQSAQAPTISSGVLTVKAPNYTIRGSTTYMTSSAWSSLTDIRYQWIAEVWRAPKGGTFDGWYHNANMRHIAECARNGGTLT